MYDYERKSKKETKKLNKSASDDLSKIYPKKNRKVGPLTKRTGKKSYGMTKRK